MKTQNRIHILPMILACLLLQAGCKRSGASHREGDEPKMLFAGGSYPQAIKDGNTYYYMMPDSRRGYISIYSAATPDSLATATPVAVWETDDPGFQHIWSPELHKIGGKWYIHFEADDGNTDNHHIYVLENESENPQTRHWHLKGPVTVNEEWNYGIHPSVFTVGDRLYMIWSGWEKRRTETETQCIFIAEMENPWTLKSERVLLSRPEYEWERQWINPDGSCSAYPIFVNENPEAYISPDGKRVIINYSASGIWTEFSTLGMLSAPIDADLLDARSWTKSTEPVFKEPADSDYRGSSNISLVESEDGKGTLMLYQTKHFHDGKYEEDAVMMKKIGWKDSMPEF